MPPSVKETRAELKERCFMAAHQAGVLLKLKTLSSILDQAGLSADELRDLL